jgi:hypothetical protein
LSQGFDQSHAKRPHVAGRGKPSAGGFGRVIHARLGNAKSFARAEEPVGREFDLIPYGHDICGLQMTEHKTLTVNAGKGVENGNEHFASFLRCERPLRKNLQKIFRSILHHEIEKSDMIQFAVPHFKEPKQVRMKKLSRVFPARELELGVGRIGGNKLDSSFHTIALTMLRQEHSAVIRAA